jgi:hypothetical protein
MNVLLQVWLLVGHLLDVFANLVWVVSWQRTLLRRCYGVVVMERVEVKVLIFQYIVV